MKTVFGEQLTSKLLLKDLLTTAFRITTWPTLWMDDDTVVLNKHIYMYIVKPRE